MDDLTTWSSYIKTDTTAATKCNLVRGLYSLFCQNGMLISMLRSDKDEPHQEHRLGTASNNITRGFKSVYGISTLALGPGAVHTCCLR